METERPVLVLRTKDLQKTHLFYEALGLTLVEERHAGCPPHYSCDFRGLLLEFYPAASSEPLKTGNDLRFFFDTDRFDALLETCRKLGLECGRVSVRAPNDAKRLVTVRDPDGRPVRIREKANKAPH